MMLGTQKKAEQGVIQSSIALLQERFKQLQRVKEMREKRQLVQIFSTVNNSLNHNNNNPTSCVTLSTTNNSSPTMTDSSTVPCANPNPNNNDSLSNVNDDDNNNNNNNNKLQVFLPPNYYYNYSSYQSSSSPSSSTSSSSSSLLNNNNLINHTHQDEVSLSLWPLVSPSATQLQSAREMGHTFKLEDEHYTESQSQTQDVDTTLHL